MPANDTANRAYAESRTRGLKPFKPGQSGNPTGRPKGFAEFGQLIREYLAQPGKKEKTELLEVIKDLRRRDLKTLLAYAYGKPKETHDVTVNTVAGLPEETTVALQKLAVAYMSSLTPCQDTNRLENVVPRAN